MNFPQSHDCGLIEALCITGRCSAGRRFPQSHDCGLIEARGSRPNL